MKRMLIVLCAASALLVTGAAVALAGGSSKGGEVHVYGVNPGTTNNQIIITGAVAARGETSNISTNIGMVTTPQGTFKVKLDKLNDAPGTGGINADTCSGAFTVSGPITLFDGTGAYKGISGTILLHETFAAIVPRTKAGKCSDDANPLTSLSFFEGGGTVSF